MSSTTTALRVDPLADAVDAGALKTYLERLRAAGQYPPLIRSSSAALGYAIGIAVGAMAAIPLLGILVVIAVLGGQRTSPITTGFIALVIGAIVVVVVVVARTLRERRIRWFRLARFAEANGFAYWPRAENPMEPGLLFGIGDTRVSEDLVRDARRGVDIGNYRYTTGSGKSRSTHRWGYVALRLPHPLPNIVLDATSNNGLLGTNLPVSFSDRQILHLEGDFDRWFTLYCPADYERDALYLFTPDIMARFIDHAAALDVEIADDRLYLYARRELSTLDPATWEWLLSTVDALRSKLAQWERWRDDRLRATDPVLAPSPATPAGAPPLLRPPPGVAPQGRRLKRRISRATIVLLVVVGLWILAGRIIEVVQLVH